MIRYNLRCQTGHTFESWFRDSAAYDSLRAAGAVTCAACGSPEVEKALMAPAISTGGSGQDPAVPSKQHPALSVPAANPMHEMLAALRREIEANADYVGPRFAEEARRIHDGAADTRAIWGEATSDEARALLDDGIPLSPLPWLVQRDD